MEDNAESSPQGVTAAASSTEVLAFTTTMAMDSVGKMEKSEANDDTDKQVEQTRGDMPAASAMAEVEKVFELVVRHESGTHLPSAAPNGNDGGGTHVEVGEYFNPLFQSFGLAKRHIAYISEHDDEEATLLAEVPHNSTTRFNSKLDFKMPSE